MKPTVVVLQSAYIPWKGYFHLMREADLFVFHDDLQYTHSDWRTRNRIVTPNGPQWLTIPAGRNEKRLICEVEVADQSWKAKHRRAIEQNYGRAPCFAECRDLLDMLYDNSITNLSEYNQWTIERLARRLHVDTPRQDSRQYQLHGRSTERLIELLGQVGAGRYLSGPAGRDYLNERLFDEAGIELSYFEYPDYPDYPQQFGARCHQVSVLDLLLNVGSRAEQYIWP